MGIICQYIARRRIRQEGAAPVLQKRKSGGFVTSPP